MAGQEDRADLVSELFAQLTARFEDAAGIAGESQARLSAGELRANARGIQAIIAEANILSRAITELLEGPDRGKSLCRR